MALDQTIDDLPCARNVCRSDKRQSRTASGKCAVATPTDYLASTDQTTSLPEIRSSASGILASMVRTWKQALYIVQPETHLRGPRELFRVFWKHTSKARSSKPRLSHETIRLIKEMAANNRLCGAERIRGELLKLDIQVSKRTIQKYMKQIRRKTSQWTELENLPAQSCSRGMGL